MSARTYVRLISGAVCLAVAMANAFVDFLRKEKPVVAPIPLEAPARPEDVCLDDEGEPCPVDETLQILAGDTFSSVLERAKIDGDQARDVIDALKEVFNPRELRPDHELYITYMPLKTAERARDLLSLYIRPSIDSEITVERLDNGRYKAHQEMKELVHTTEIVKGEIQDSLFLDGGKQGVPAKILHQMIKLFGHVVDFQRDFHPGDGYGLIYNTAKDPDSLREKPGELSFAYLRLREKELRFYFYKPRKGNSGFYDASGSSLRKGLLRTPVDGARLSSGFGKRKHPVLGYSKMHKGVDFAAPKGTPIMAAGDGVVEKLGPFSSYGNYIRLRHNSELSTAYAHMSRFATGLRAGKSVRQGQVIGYIGMTGRTTGPHLHYELLRFGKQVDPKHVKTMPAGKLAGADLNAFKALASQINKRFDTYVPPVVEAHEEEEAPDEVVPPEEQDMPEPTDSTTPASAA